MQFIHTFELRDFLDTLVSLLSAFVLGTLIGAFIIAVIQNGMNLLGIHTYTQMVVLGAVIIGAVVLDRIRIASGAMGRA